MMKSIDNTEAPRRVKPINVYYHMYSGEKLSSLRALLENLRYASSGEICPITAGQYAAVADGFYSASIEALGAHTWRITNRAELQTIRFDDALKFAVDFANSTGVVGQRYEQDRLYVALDAADPAPVIALRPRALSTKKELLALIERPYSRETQAVGAVPEAQARQRTASRYDRPGVFVQS